MLTDRSSVFDTKSFLRQTVRNLAGEINISYIHLLRLLIEERDQPFTQQVNSPELIRLLQALYAEEVLIFRKQQYVNISEFLDHAGYALKKKMDAMLLEPDKTGKLLSTWLTPLLANPESCRILLIKLTEPEIIRLLPFIIPREKEFIVQYAHALDRQKEQNGTLEGKAGHKFNLLKWMVIFPVLLSNRGAGFNRKYFVRDVLKNIAAHYNLRITELLHYFIRQETPSWPHTLQQLFHILYKEETALPERVSGGVLKAEKNKEETSSLKCKPKSVSKENIPQQNKYSIPLRLRKHICNITFEQAGQAALSYTANPEKGLTLIPV